MELGYWGRSKGRYTIRKRLEIKGILYLPEYKLDSQDYMVLK
jgi:hypothetical protein